MPEINLGLLRKLFEAGKISEKTLAMAENSAGKLIPALEKEPGLRDKMLARYGNDPKDPMAWKAGKSMDMASNVNHPYIKPLSGVPISANEKFAVTQAGQEIGHPGIMESHGSSFMDPLPWSDDKYQVTKKALLEAKAKGFPVKLNTSSDLIGKEDYISSLPHGSEVNIYLPTKDAGLNNNLFPGNPSRQRLEAAVEKLKSSGIKVNAIEPDEASIREAMARKVDTGGLKFGAQADPGYQQYIDEKLKAPGTFQPKGVEGGGESSSAPRGALSVVRAAAPLAGAAFQNPLDLIGQGTRAYSDAKDAVARPLAKQLNLSGNPQDTEYMAKALSTVADPVNFIPGAPGVGLQAIQAAGDLAPQKFSQGGNVKMKITAENAEQLFRRGLIKEGTYQQIQKLAGGGNVAAQPTSSFDAAMAEMQNPTPANAQPLPLTAGNSLVFDPATPVQMPTKPNLTSGAKFEAPFASSPEEAGQAMSQQYSADQASKFESDKAAAEAAARPTGRDWLMNKPADSSAMSADVSPAPESLAASADGVDLVPTQPRVDSNPASQMMNGMMNSQGQIGQALDAEGRAAMMGAQAGAAGAAAQAKYLSDLSLQMNQLELQRQSSEALRQKTAQEAQDKLSQATEDFQKKSVIDPNRYMAEKSTGNKIALGIALFFSGINGSKNGLEIVQNAINRDVDAQKANINSQREGLAMQSNLYKDMLGRFGDERQAELATKQAMMGMAEIKIKQVMAGTQSQQATAQGMQALAEIQVKKAQMGQEFMRSVMTSPIFQAQDNRLRRVLMIGNPQTQELAQKELQEYDKHEKVLKNIESNFEAMMQNRRGLVPYTQSKQQYDSASSAMQTLTTEMFGGKSEQEFKIIQNMFPKPTDTRETANKKLDMLKDKFNSQVSFPNLEGFGIIKKPLPLVRK